MVQCGSFVKDVNFGSALNLRNKCDPKVPKNICGNYFAPINVAIDKDDCVKGIWHLANVYKRNLAAVIQDSKFLPTVYDHKKMNEIVKGFMGEKKGTTQEQIGSSFLGNVQFITSCIRVLEFSFYPKHAGRINMMSYIIDDYLKVMICFDRNYRTKSWMSMLIDNFVCELNSSF